MTAALGCRPAFAACLAILLVRIALLAPSSAVAQEPSPDVTYTRQTIFRIPFQTDPNEKRIKQVQLYVSHDLGRTWHPYATARPEEAYFAFTAQRDGTYWYAVRTVDLDNRAHPLTMENVKPGLRVVVDTQPPHVAARPVPMRDGMVGIEWEVRDEHLDLQTLTLDVRQVGFPEWTPQHVEPLASGQQYFRVAGPVEARLRVRDRAGNEGEAKTLLGGGSQPIDPLPRNQPVPPPGAPGVRMVNSKKISLNYELKEVGPSGVSIVELWYTQDGKNWQKYGDDPDHKPPFEFEVNDEGLYGLTLVVKSGVGLGDQPPRPGDPPQVWIEVDVTKPVVRIVNVEVGRGLEAGTVTITWTATDKNLGRQPITLAYSEQPTGPWTPLAANLENSGRHVWRLAPSVPYRFHVRVEAVDRAGNSGVAETTKHVIVDLAQPKAVIGSVEPSGPR